MQQQHYVPADEVFEGDDDETAYRARLQKELTKNWSHGFCRMPDLVRQDRTLSPKAKIVYEQLLSYLWFHSDHCWPSQYTLAQATGYSRRSVIRACKELYERGYIEKWRRGQGYTNFYFINPLTFPQSFRRTAREPIATMILDIHAPELRQDITNCTPRSSAEIFSMCHDGTFSSDTVAHPEVTTWHPNQMKGKQIHGKEMDSNDSSSPPQKEGRAFPVAPQATRNEQQHAAVEPSFQQHRAQQEPISIHQQDEPPDTDEEVSYLALLQQQQQATEREQQRALQQWRTTYDANNAASTDSEQNEVARAKTTEPPAPSKKPNSSVRNRSQGNDPENAKEVREDNKYHNQTKQAAIAALTGIPQSHLEEVGNGQDGRRPIPEFLKNMISHFSHELGDYPRCTKSNITQAAKLYFFAHDYIIAAQADPQGFFAELLYQAKADAYHVSNIRYHNPSGRPNRMPVFFTCLQHEMQLSEEELNYLRSDEILFEPAWR